MSQPWEYDYPERQLLFEIRGLKRAIERGATWNSHGSRARQKRIGVLANKTGQGAQTKLIMSALKKQARSASGQEGRSQADA